MSGKRLLLVEEEQKKIQYKELGEALETLTPGRGGGSTKMLLLEPLKPILLRCRQRGVAFNRITEVCCQHGLQISGQTLKDVIAAWEEEGKIALSPEDAAKKPAPVHPNLSLNGAKP